MNCPNCGKFMSKTDVWDIYGKDTPKGNLHKLWICYKCLTDLNREE